MAADLDRYCVNDTFTIKEVMETFEVNNERVAVVRNQNKKVVGVISQGDIIRALAAGMDLFAYVQQIIQPSFLYRHKVDMEEIYNIFRTKKITLLPIVDANFYLTDVVTLSNVFHYLEEKGGEKS